MKHMRIFFLAAICLSSPALAQQNQTPGDTGAGGNSRDTSGLTAAHAAQAGANTSDATTTGASGPSAKKGGKAAAIALAPLPDAKLCDNYEGDVKTACLSTILNGKSGATP